MPDKTKAWMMLFAAGIFEILWTVGMKYSQGFTRLWPSLFTLITLAISMGLLGFSLKTLPMGTAYAIWTGIGAIGTVILGIILFDESRDFLKIFFISLIIIGIAGLKFIAK